MSLLAGCQGGPPALPGAPALATEQRVYVGSVLSGPVATTQPSVSVDATAGITLRWIALTAMPEQLSPIDAQSRLTVAPQSDNALLSTGQLTRGVRFAAGAEADAYWQGLARLPKEAIAVIAQRSAVVAPGTTLVFSISSPGGAGRRVSIDFSLPASEAATRPQTGTVAVQVSDGTGTWGPATRPTGLRMPETAIVDSVPIGRGDAFVVALPYEMPETPWRAIVAIAAIDREPPSPAMVQQLRSDLQPSGPAAGEAVVDDPAMLSALDALRQPGPPRPALLLLSSVVEARIAGDFVLVAEQEQLPPLVQAILDRTSQTLPTRPALQWFLDSYAMRTMCEAAMSESLAAPLQSVLALHTGDVARRPDAILDLLKQADSSAAFAERLIAENMIALEDNSTASRVRAFDWLTARGRAPAGFDPLADIRSRRAAIDRALNPQGGQP